MMRQTRERATLEMAVQLAQINGWAGYDIVKRERGNVQRVVLRRDDENLHLTAWVDSGNVHSLHGQLATGQVSSRPVNSSWNSHITADELTTMLENRRRDEYTNNSGFELLVHEGEVHKHWETACNYTAHRTVPGRYPLEVQTIGWQRVADEQTNVSQRPYYVAAKVLTVELSRHYVNRIFQHSSAHDEEVNAPSSIHWNCYSYQLPEQGEPKTMGELFTIVPVGFGEWR